VPQGSVLSPHLFNFFLSDFPAPAQLNLSYADDIQLAESSPDVKTLGPVLTNHLSEISQWSKDNKLGIASEKSHVTIFTPFNREANFDPNITIDNLPVPVNKRPKLLGLNFQGFFNMREFLRSKLTKGHQLMKAVSGQDFGDKETFVSLITLTSNPASLIWLLCGTRVLVLMLPASKDCSRCRTRACIP
jgi:hypothetical protein